MEDNYSAAFAADREAYFAQQDIAEAIKEATTPLLEEIADLKRDIQRLERELDSFYEEQAGENI